MRKKKMALFLSAGLILSTALTGCQGQSAQTTDNGSQALETSQADTEKNTETPKEEPAEPVELELWSGFTSTDGDIMQDIFNKFNEENEWGITIKMDLMSWDTIDEKLPAAIAAGEAPDFVTGTPARYKNYGNAGVFRDMSDFWDKYPDIAANIPDNVKELYTWNDVMIGIPLQVQSYYYFWDKDLFAAAGLDPEKPASTFEEMLEYAKILTDASKNQYGILLPVDNFAATTTMMLNYGADYTDEDETTATFNSENCVRAFTDLKELYVNGCTPKDSDDNSFISGQCAQMINSSWIINGLRENEINFGIAPVPAAEGCDPSIYFSLCGWAIPSTTTDEKVIDAIYKAVAYWNSVEVSQRWYLEAGSPCYNTAAIASIPEENKALLEVLSAPNEYGHVELVKTGMTIVGSDVLRPAMEEILLNDADIQTTLDKYNGVMQELIDHRDD